MAPPAGFAFGPFRLDPERKQLFRDGEPVPIGARHADLLTALVAHAGQFVTKDDLVAAGWSDVAVTDNSVEQAISALRRVVGPSAIETQRRRGYRFTGEVTRLDRRESDAVLDALLAPHRAWIEGRAALETLEGTRIRHAREVFERVLAVAPDQAPAHVGLANACLFQFEMTRIDVLPDRDALTAAHDHAREACRLDPAYGEAWATLGMVLERAGHPGEARAALRRAITLEPDNWRHHLRLAYGSWGEERLRASSRTLALLADFPMAHWLAATVHIARQAFPEAERELAAGLAAQSRQAAIAGRFGAVALHWLSGLLSLAHEDDAAALEAFGRELAGEGRGLLYERECCANVDYAMGALHLRRGRQAEARAALERAVARMPRHALAHVVLAVARGEDPGPVVGALAAVPAGDVDAAMARAAARCAVGAFDEGAAIVERALDAAPPGSAGWLLPVDPWLHVRVRPAIWAGALARLAARAV